MKLFKQKRRMNLKEKLLLLMGFFIFYRSVLLTGTNLIFAYENYVSDYQNFTSESNIEEDTSALKSSDASIIKADRLIEETEKMISRTDEIILEQKKLKYKYEDIPLDDYLKEKVLIESAVNNIDPDIAFGMYYVESKFKIKAASKYSSARGLGQIIESTARECYKELYKGQQYNHDLAFNPEINIELTCHYLGKLYKIYGNYNDALRAYNGYEIKNYDRLVMKYSNGLKDRIK